ncbi:aminotransferase class IV [Mariniphaga sp.]|uniref:aminotransferase class IV n=1 Tax=Mariniphaga sp. TaxID=1954475 RepID=UPI003567863C
MVYFPLHRYFIFNGELRPNALFKAFENSGGIYEVLRVENGVPLFMEDHLERFYHSASLAGKTIRFNSDQISRFILELIHENKVLTGNILLSCKENLKAFFILHKYPDPKWYQNGVRCGILKAERENPNAKVFQTPVRQQADKLMEKKDLYEVLLVDHLNRITEGSRSNVFFVEKNALFTPPGNEVLLGITRQKTILLAKEAGIPFFEKDVLLEDLPRFQAAFITGTSPKILPVSQIGEGKFDPQNYLVQLLRKKYDELIADYIKSVL